MDALQYRQLSVALSISLFVAYLTSRFPDSPGNGLIALLGVLAFSCVAFFVVTSSSSLYVAIATSLNQWVKALVSLTIHRSEAGHSPVVPRATPVLILPFCFQLPPPDLSR